MKILLIGNSQSYLSKRLAEECKKTRDTFLALPPKNIIIKCSPKKIELRSRSGINLLKFDAFYFYAVGRHLPELTEVARFLRSSGKIVVEEILSRGSLPNDKFFLDPKSTLVAPPYTFFFQLNDDDLKKLTYPLMVKSVTQSRGRGILKVNNATELKTAKEKIGPKLIIQKFYEINHDYRVLVVGNNALGVIKRYKKTGDFLTIRRGGRREEGQLPKTVLKNCVLSSRARGLEIAGVDVVKYGQNYYIWEINSSPQCQVFEKQTGVNVASKIIQHIKSKYSAKKT